MPISRYYSNKHVSMPRKIYNDEKDVRYKGHFADPRNVKSMFGTLGSVFGCGSSQVPHFFLACLNSLLLYLYKIQGWWISWWETAVNNLISLLSSLIFFIFLLGLPTTSWLSYTPEQNKPPQCILISIIRQLHHH